MTGRNPQASESSSGLYNSATDPVPMYDFWDKHQLGNTSMCGWWQNCVVKVSDDLIKVTTFTYGVDEYQAAVNATGQFDGGDRVQYCVLAMASFSSVVGMVNLCTDIGHPAK